MGKVPTRIDEQGRSQIKSHNAVGKGTDAKLRSVRRQGVREGRDLDGLERETRELDVEVLKAKTKATHAASELYSPPRIVKLLKEWGWQGGYSLDLTHHGPDGQRWDFTKASHRLRAWRLLKRDGPYLLIGSPPCTMCSLLQNLSRGKEGREERFQEKLREAAVHLEFCVKLYNHQPKRGLYFLHEHPAGASSWVVPCIEELAKRPMVSTVVSHMCAFGMVSTFEDGSLGPVKKPTRFMSNSTVLLSHLDRRCKGCPKHAHLLAGRASKAAIYPINLCKAVAEGLRAQMELDIADMMVVPVVGDEQVDVGALWEAKEEQLKQYWDDVF